MDKKIIQNINIIGFLSPALILIVLFYFAPSIMALVYSFTDKTLIGVKSQNFGFVGLSNYTKMFSDPRYIKSLINTAVFLLFSAVLGQQILGFTIARFMEKQGKTLQRLVGTSVLLGWVTPEVVVAFVFFAFFNTTGSLNNLLGVFGIKPIAWLFDYGMLAVILANIWRGTAFSMLMYQSALANVPDDSIEAAWLDGANSWQLLFKIILPIIKGTIVTNTILVTLQTIGLFGLIFALTGGGPGYDTTTVPIYMYQKSFISYQLGYGTAMAIVLLIFGILLSALYMKSFKHEM
ncbi:carbohydrate ABC transporter permease [Oceanispirochaeta sp.]|uniref:carbohydrate ABC transporter permease n=1 Tax=Oceanispirochaeta sp. TaxID=2035350 RepID=UPI002618884B|nr:sugar ABC transporter permease [Oceanispirochaeta sp.]MDA3958725.1 sugar ABC transporter permease [Oceanispirochaeta sp.]